VVETVVEVHVCLDLFGRISRCVRVGLCISRLHYENLVDNSDTTEKPVSQGKGTSGRWRQLHLGRFS